jgi:hypothetical protein
MQERHHVKTTPGEAKAPEVVPHPVRKEPGGNVQTDDINIPMVAVFVAFFAVLLAVTITGLQAWFYNYQAAERAAKTAPQDDPSTELGAILHEQRAELTTPGLARPAPGATGAATQNRPNRVPIDQAMADVVAAYARSRGANR